MKKLIAFISSVAIVLSFSLSSFAATATTKYEELEGDLPGYGTFTTTVTADVTGQATILAVKGSELSTTYDNIQFIDQKTAGTGANAKTEFTYKLMDQVEAGKEYSVMVGGSTLTSAIPAPAVDKDGVPLAEFIPRSGDGYTITGEVSNPALPADEETFNWFWEAQDLVDNLQLLNSKWQAKAEIISFSDLPKYLRNIIVDEGNEINIIASADVLTDGSFTIELDPLETAPVFETGDDPNYCLIVTRNGYLTFFKKIYFENKNIPLADSIELIPGDVMDSIDLGVSDTDFLKIFGNPASFFDGYDYYFPEIDLNGDGFVNDTDSLQVFAHSGNEYLEYVEDGIEIGALTWIY